MSFAGDGISVRNVFTGLTRGSALTKLRGGRPLVGGPRPRPSGPARCRGEQPAMSERTNECAGLEVPPFDFDRPRGENDRLFEQSMALLCIVGFDGYMKHWNPAWNGVFGYTSQEMLSLPLDSLVHPLDRPRLSAIREQLLARQAISSDEIRIRCKDGACQMDFVERGAVASSRTYSLPRARHHGLERRARPVAR